MKSQYPKEFLERVGAKFGYSPSNAKCKIIAHFMAELNVDVSETIKINNYDKLLYKYIDGRPIIYIGTDKRYNPLLHEFITIRKEGDQCE